MPIWQQPSGPQYSPRGGLGLEELAQTWLQARQLKAERMGQQRGRTLLEQLMGGQGIQSAQVPAGAMAGTGATGQPPSGIGGVMRGLGEFMTGGRVSPEQVPMSDIEKLMMESAIKQKFAPPKKWEPTTKEEAFEFEREKATAKEEAKITREKSLAGAVKKLKEKGASINEIVEGVRIELKKMYPEIPDKTLWQKTWQLIRGVLGQ